jgi:hypothetical protein
MNALRLPLAALCIAFLRLVPTSALAQTQELPSDTYEVGGAQIVVPAPWKGMVEMGIEKRHFMDQFVPPSNRLIAGYVSIDELPAIRAGDVKAPARIAIVATSRQFESLSISEADFKQIIESAGKNFDTTVSGYAKDNEEQFNRRIEALHLDSPQVSFAEPISLGCLFSTPDSAAFGTILHASKVGSSAKPSGPSTLTKAVSVIYVRVKKHILFMYIYADYKDKDTAIWLRTAGESWATAVLNANKE